MTALPGGVPAGVHIHAPRPWQRKVFYVDCPECGMAKAPMVVAFYEWYGPHATCLHCGDSWQDDERMERPFAPKWRQKRIAAALATLNQPLGPAPWGGQP